MVGKTSVKRRALPTTAVDVARAKYDYGMKRAVVPTGKGTEVVVKSGAKGTAFAGQPQVVHRKMGRALAKKGYEKATGTYGTSSRARALKGCTGKRGCDFVGCVKEAMGHVPVNLAKACPAGAALPRGPPMPAAAELASARATLVGMV